MSDNFHLKKNYTGNNLAPQDRSKKSPYEQFQRDEEEATKNHQLGKVQQKYKQRRRKLIKGAMNRPSALVNKTGNARNGQSYFVSPTKGGAYHVYDNGKRVFVRKSKSKINKSSGIM